jgi:hypothetical protein
MTHYTGRPLIWSNCGAAPVEIVAADASIEPQIVREFTLESTRSQWGLSRGGRRHWTPSRDRQLCAARSRLRCRRTRSQRGFRRASCSRAPCVRGARIGAESWLP